MIEEIIAIDQDTFWYLNSGELVKALLFEDLAKPATGPLVVTGYVLHGKSIFAPDHTDHRWGL